MSELALSLIAEAKRTNAKTLDLGNCGLTELPEALFDLVELEELYLCSKGWSYDFEKKEDKHFESQNKGDKNNIKRLSPKIGQLKNLKILLANGDYDNKWDLSDLSPLKDLANLQQLNVDSTQVSDLSPLKDLAKLQQLYVQRTQVSDLSPLKNLAKLQQLYVDSTQVSDLSPLKNLAKLQQLSVSDTQVNDLSPLKNLTNLQQLSVDSTQVNDLSPLKNLAKLQQLYVDSTQVSDLSPLKNLAKLQQLYVDSTQVSDLSPLKNLAKLQQLYVSDTQVNDLSPLKNLVNLQQLYVDSTQVSDLSPLKNLVNLQQLYVDSTQVSDLSPLKNLAKLQQLYVSDTQVSDLSPLKNLANLQQLYVSSTQVSNLSPLKDLANLQQLYVSDTQVSDLSPLKDLGNLQQLNVSDTQVSNLSPLKDLGNLQQLNVSNTQVSDLSPLKTFIEKGMTIRWSSYEGDINVEGCPLDKALIAAIKKGQEAVLTYLNKPKERLFEARVLVLGEPRAGKTTLRRKLKSPSAEMPKDTESTKAFEIEIEPYKCKVEKGDEKNTLTYHLWDFGGQDYYRLLHQLFVAEQSVYVIVTDTDRNKNEEEINFWLETIQRQGKDKSGKYGPVILFQNPKANREGGEFVDLKKRYPFWRQTEQFTINLLALDEKATTFDPKELNKFKRFKTYLEESFCHLDHIGREMPRQWANVRRALAKLEKDNHITVEEFNKVCKSKGVMSEKEQDDLLDIFHTLGYLLHYKNSALQSMVILNREWVTDALYRVLDDKTVSDNKGWFVKADAEKIWNEARYKNRTNELLGLMQEFKLSYYNTTSQKYIVPAKLSEYTEGFPDWDTTQNVRLYLQYDWMPRAVPTQLVVTLHNYLVETEKGEQWIWRSGAVLDGKTLDLKGVQVKIEDDWRNNRIQINAKGTHSEILIRTIMKHWREVNQPFEDKVKVDKIILCSCGECTQLEEPHIFKYDDVLNAIEKKRNLQCNKSLDDFSPTDILRGLFDDTTVSLDAFTRKGGQLSDEVRGLLADGKLDTAFEKLPKDDYMTQLQSRFSELKKKNNIGVVSNADFNLEWNKIMASLLEYLSDYDKRSSKGGSFRGGERLQGISDSNRDKADFPKNYEKVEVHTHNYYNSQVYQSDKIDKIEYNQNLGMSKEEFDVLKKQLENLTAVQQTELKNIISENATTETAKTNIGQKALHWLNKNAEGIVGNVAASVYYDVLKGLLGIG